jgi:hypothetical protein
MLNWFKVAKKSLDPVVDAYVHALLGRYPRARYLCGLDALMMATLAAMPEWFSDWAVERLMPKFDDFLPTSSQKLKDASAYRKYAT